MGNRKMLENVGTRQVIGRTVVELCQADYTHKNPHLYRRKNVHNSVDNVDKHGKTAEILNYLTVDNFFFMGKTGDEMCINKKKNIYIFFCKFSPDQRKNKKYINVLKDIIIYQGAVRRYVLHLRLPW